MLTRAGGATWISRGSMTMAKERLENPKMKGFEDYEKIMDAKLAELPEYSKLSDIEIEKAKKGFLEEMVQDTSKEVFKSTRTRHEYETKFKVGYEPDGTIKALLPNCLVLAIDII